MFHLLTIGRILLRWRTIIIKNPYQIALLLRQILLLISWILCGIRKIIRFILFLVYVGGLIVLIVYCVMLVPARKSPPFNPLTITPTALGLVFFYNPGLFRSFSFGLHYRASIIVLIALVLFLVILSVVDVIDYSMGNMKYVKSLIICSNLFDNLLFLYIIKHTYFHK